MNAKDNVAAMIALAKARGIELDPEATHLTLRELAAVAGESEATARRAIWGGRLRAETIAWRYQIPILEAARYVVEGGTPTKPKEA